MNVTAVIYKIELRFYKSKRECVLHNECFFLITRAQLLVFIVKLLCLIKVTQTGVQALAKGFLLGQVLL